MWQVKPSSHYTWDYIKSFVWVYVRVYVDAHVLHLQCTILLSLAFYQTTSGTVHMKCSNIFFNLKIK